MPDKSLDRSKDSGAATKRTLPSWMSSKENNEKSHRKKTIDSRHVNDDDGNKTTNSTETRQKSLPFSKIMEGVVFALSGFVNPERSTLRSQALEMGAEYRPDWSSDCTLLVCAFANTPKFRQVESDCGTIVSKDWISECYNQKKLIEIDPYLMHAGKPWRQMNKNYKAHEDERKFQHRNVEKQVKRSHAMSTGCMVPKAEPSSSFSFEDHFTPSKVSDWAADDLSQTISWLQSQEQKPEPDEVKKIAAQGIITCLQDAIESLRENHDIRLVMEQWMFVPRVVKELANVEVAIKKGSPSKQELLEQAMTCKKIYERKYEVVDGSPSKSKKWKTDNGRGLDYDSDQTIEMTEEEIELASKELDSAF